MKPKNLIILSLIFTLSAAGLIGYIFKNRKEKEAFSVSVVTPNITNTQNDTSSKSALIISADLADYKDDNFRFTFSYPRSLTFETLSPYPGGTIKALTFRVDGITDSTLLSKDLGKSLMANELYCNLDSSYGSAVCTNQKVEPYTNSKGTGGYIITREKQLYKEDQEEPDIFTDFVYAFPLKVESSYKVIVFSVKYPSKDNLDLLKQISNSMIVN